MAMNGLRSRVTGDPRDVDRADEFERCQWPKGLRHRSRANR